MPLVPKLLDLPDQTVGMRHRRRAAPGQIIQQADGTLLECFDHHLFPGKGHVEWRRTEKYGPAERSRLPAIGPGSKNLHT